MQNVVSGVPQNYSAEVPEVAAEGGLNYGFEWRWVGEFRIYVLSGFWGDFGMIEWVERIGLIDGNLKIDLIQEKRVTRWDKFELQRRISGESKVLETKLNKTIEPNEAVSKHTLMQLGKPISVMF